jgi:hypothetical protein
MNQYLNETNQSMIWKVINNAPQVIQYFKLYPPGTKEQWFQSIIKNIYYQFNGSNISLKELNKRTLDFMLQSIEEPPQKQPQQQQQPQQQKQQQQQQQQQQQPVFSHTQPSFVDQTNFIKPREQIVAEQFELRKKEYESMTKKSVPKPEFTNAIKDEAINDIGSAVEEYMKQRNADIPAYAPIQPKEVIELNVEELPPIEQKKRVQWGDNSEHTFDNQQPVIDYSEKIKSLEDRIQIMDGLIKELIGKITILENSLVDIKPSR